ncbi:MAG: Bug family tripartite tricarboxylate transporter substrate binding protein [Thermodesulfobacteriota bacterium]
MKRCGIFWLACGLVLLTSSVGVQAQEKYPNRAIELVVPVAPGGSVDTATRIYSDDLARALKVPVTVVNRAGGTGIIGAAYVAAAKKDGYTLLQGSSNSIITMPVISKEATYDPVKDFAPIGYFVSVPSMFCVRVDSPFKTLAELLDYARKNPGKLKNGAAGVLSESQFNMEILLSYNKIVIKTVPYKGGGEALPALLGGHVDLATISLTTLGPQVKAGKLRALAVTSKVRHPDFPDIPTTTELGYPYADFNVWNGLFAPAGVPQSVLDVLVPTVEKIFKSPEVVNRAKQAGFTVEYMNPDELRKFVESKMEVTRKIAKEANLIKK